MKNFTKQNFKTNPLWIRLIIMAFMLFAGAGTVWGARTIYLSPGVWEATGAWYAAWIYGGGVSDSWYTATKMSDGNYRFDNVPDAAATMILTRQQSGTTYGSPNWSPWNRIDGISLTDKSKNLFTITDWGAGSWSTYTPPCNVAVSVSKSPDQSVYLTGETVTLTATTTNETSFVWKEGSTQVSTSKTYSYTKNTVGSVTLKAVATASCGNAEKEVALSFVNQKKIVVKCKGTDNIHLYTWSGTNTDDTNTWPGATTTKEGDYYVWEISTETPINIQFNKGSNNPQTKDINGLQVGYEYVFTWSGKHDESISLPTPTELPKPCTKPDKPSIELSTNSICNGDNTQVRINVTGDADTYVLYVVNNGYTKQSNEAVNNTFTVSPTKTTTYVVKAFNGACASDYYSNEEEVTVSEKPSITLNPTSTAICKGDELDLSKFASSTVDLTWWNGETQITAPVSPETNTTYTVKAINGACTVTKDFPVTVNALPNAPGLENSASSQCVTANGTVNLNTLASPVGTVYWYDSSSQLISNATVSIATAGKFTYTAKAVSNGCESLEGTSFTLTVKEQLDKPTLSVTNIIKCDNTYTDGKIVIENYNNANTYVLKKDSKPIEKIYKEGYLITKDEIGSYTVEVSKEGSCGAVSEAKTVNITDNTPSATVTLNTDRERLCADNDVVLTCDVKNLDGTITNYVWKNANGEQVATGEALSTITIKNVTASTTYSVVVTVVKNSCSKDFEASVNLVVKSRPEAPKFDDEKMTACTGVPFSLPMPNNLKEGEEPVWTIEDKLIPAGNVTLDEKGDYEFKAYKNDGCISDATKFIVTVNPLPTISIAADLDAVNVGKVTLTATGENIVSIVWSATDGTKDYTVTSTSATTATITSDENAIITVTAVATSANGCVATATKEITFGSEDCFTSSADYIEILCRRTDNPGSTDADLDMHCYAWITGTTSTLLGGWPGVKTENGDFEYQGKKYAVWHIKSDAEVSIVFNNNNDTQKTGDIPGHVKGYRYVYTLSSDYKTATLYEEPSLINMPEVRTISVTSERQANGDLKVYMSGKILKKGCTAIKSYGFQYKKDNGDYTGTAGVVEGEDKNAGFVFTAETTLTKGNYGEYTFRARLINENSTKVYGEEFKIYFYESDVFIEAVGGDKQVTNKSGVYYDFVGLYVKNVTVPAGVSISRYKWFKGGVEYNGGNATVADRGVSSSSNNIRPNEAGTYTCEVYLSNGDILESNEIEVSATNTYSEVVTSTNRNLPVISVRTNEAFPTCETAGTTGAYPSTNIEGWKEKRSVDVKIFNADGTLYYDRKARMNYRGSSSLNFNKKSYAFCPGEENCGQEKDKTPDYVTTTKMNLFGLSDGAKDKDWVLYAAAADPTLMRNRIVFDTYADMTGKWGVDSKYVELVIDGVYQGVYVLMDKITNNEKRVNITDPNGFIVKFDKTDIADREADLLDAGQEVGDEKTFQTKRTGRVGIQTYHTFVDQLFEIEYPEKKKVVKNGGDWSTTLSAIKQKIEEFETALADGDYIKVRSLIDYESWADWFIINEFTKNVDAYRASCVFVYNGNKIEAQPLWDQELSFNNAAGASIGKKGADKTTGLLIENNGVYTDCFPAPFWWTGTQSSFNNCGTDNGESTISSEKIQNYLLKDECFVATIKDRWDTHTEEGGALHKDQLMAKYSALLNELGAAKDREITKWPSDHRVADACGSTGTGYNKVTFDESASTLTEWINKDLVIINSESESASRASNLNYLIENMEGEPLRFDLTLNPASGVTTPWIPITVTVEVPDGYEYTYDDSSIKANEGVIIKSTTNKHSYTFPRPENWNTGNQGEGNEIEPLFYEVNVSLNIETTETASCGESKFETSKTAIISLQDEGDDLCNYAD